MLASELLTNGPRDFLLRREALDLGLDDNALTRLVRADELVRIRQGAYASAPAWHARSPRDRHVLLTRAVQAQYEDHVVVSHTSQAIADGAPEWGFDLSTVHLTHLDGGGRRSAGIVHHQGSLRVVDLSRTVEGWFTTPTRTVLDCCSLLSTEAGLVTANWYLNQGLTSTDRLSERYAEMQRSPSMLRVRIVLLLADGRLESVGESRFLYLIWRAGLPLPIPQWEVWEGGRLVGVVDFAWPELGLMAEFDGKIKYGRHLRPGQSPADAVFAEKRREDELREITGFRMIRPVWSDLERPAATIERVRRMMRRTV